jgi:hypothetical protein
VIVNHDLWKKVICKRLQSQRVRDLASLFSSSESVGMWEKIRPMIEDARKQLDQRESGEYVPTYQWQED